jgi:hypothetical protein
LHALRESLDKDPLGVLRYCGEANAAEAADRLTFSTPSMQQPDELVKVLAQMKFVLQGTQG